ncbi:MFS transporter [Haloarchaeobius sp. DYHT-AS-18]|uniref:MFS transporter n=1 Tax=Haloarchaeobius sp. DYHT-AS-18 TaxID=3446117 RepID=UPI003EBAC02C
MSRRGAVGDGEVDGRAPVVVSLWLLTTLGYAYIIVPTSVFPLIQESMTISPLAASALISATLAAQVIANVPVGVLLDRLHNLRLLGWATVGLLVVAVWGWHAGTTGSYWSLLSSRAAGGVVTIVLWTAGVTITSGLYGVGSRATAVGFFTTSAPAGFALGQFTGPVLSESVGWAGTFVVYGVASVLVFGLLLLAASWCPSPTTPQTETPTTEQFRAALVDRQVWQVAVLGFISFSAFLVLTNWMPSYLIDEFGYSLVNSGAFVALFPATGIVSRWGGGILSDTWFGGRRRPIVIWSFVIATPAFLLLSVVVHPVLLILTLCVAGLAIQLSIGILFAYAREIVEPSVSATAVSVTSAVAVLGATVGPILTGALFTYTGSYMSIFVYTIVLSSIGIVFAWSAPEPRERVHAGTEAPSD